MLNPEDKLKMKKILDQLRAEEDTENQLIWLYQNLMDLGIENCFSEDHSSFFRDGMKKLYEESKGHKIMINAIIDKYEKNN
ncbi:MAG: hypothetical protein WC928_04005 [Patescibacteria group bacterium]|jgi:hypothetical protein